MKDLPMRLILTTAFALLPMMAMAQDNDPIAQNIEARHGFLQMLAINMGTLSGMAKGEIAYDEAGASAAAANIEALTHYNFPSLFVEGSAAGQAEDSAALPVIWTDSAGFAEKFAALGQAATGASEAVKGGQANVGPVVQALGGACKACHDVYREKS